MGKGDDQTVKTTTYKRTHLTIARSLCPMSVKGKNTLLIKIIIICDVALRLKSDFGISTKIGFHGYCTS